MHETEPLTDEYQYIRPEESRLERLKWNACFCAFFGITWPFAMIAELASKKRELLKQLEEENKRAES